GGLSRLAYGTVLRPRNDMGGATTVLAQILVPARARSLTSKHRRGASGSALRRGRSTTSARQSSKRAESRFNAVNLAAAVEGPPGEPNGSKDCHVLLLAGIPVAAMFRRGKDSRRRTAA